MKTFAASCLPMVLAMAGIAHAQVPEALGKGLKPGRTELELGGAYETLTGGRAAWRSTYLHGMYRKDAEHTLHGTLRETERFGLRDTEASAGMYFPLAAGWFGLVEGGLSETHRVLPKYSLFGQVSRPLGQGWIVSAGLRHSEYANSAADLTILGAERYFGNYRASYTLYSGRPEGGASGPAHRIQLDYYYAERSTVGVAFTSGREVENIGPPTGILSSDVRNLTVTGRHWLTPNWALTYDWLTHQQGSFYRRDGVRLGLRYGF